MWFKLILVVFLITTFVQCYVPNSDYDYDKYQANAFYVNPTPEELLEKGTKIVQDEIKVAEEQLETVKKAIGEKAAKASEKSKEEIEGIVKELIDVLNKIKEDAKAKVIDIADYLKGREQDLLNLPVDFGQRAVSCVTDKVREGKAIIDDAIRKVKDTVNVIGKLSKELEKCGSRLVALICKSEVAAKIGLAIANILVKITTNVAQAINLPATVNIAIVHCENGNVTQVGVSGLKIIEEITTCVAEETPKGSY